MTLAEVPTELRRKFVSASGRLLIRINPKVDVWDREGSTRFVEELRSVSADVTGTPIISYESIRRMEDAYRRGTIYALVLVSLISGVMIRRLRETALALTPLVLGPLWALGIMNLFGFQLNLANVWGVPLIIGASAEYGLNIVTRVMEAGAYGGPSLPRSTVMAVSFHRLSPITGVGAAFQEPVGLVARFLRQLALHGRRLALTGLHASRRHLPVEVAGDVAVLADHHDRIGVEKRQHPDAAAALDDAVDRGLAVRHRHLVFTHADPAILVDRPGAEPSPRYTCKLPTIRHDAMTSRRRAAAGL